MASERTSVRNRSSGDAAVDDDRLVVVPDVERDAVVERRSRRWPVWPFVIVALVVAAVLLTIALPGASPRPPAAQVGAEPAQPVVPSERLPWSWLAVSVPATSRSLSVTLPGGTDLLERLALGAPVDRLTGEGAIGDGVEVAEVLEDHAVAVVRPGGIGPQLVVFVPDALVAATLVPGQLVTFEGTLMPTPLDFTAMAGPEAAAIAGASGVYVAAVPATIGLLPPPA